MNNTVQCVYCGMGSRVLRVSVVHGMLCALLLVCCGAVFETGAQERSPNRPIATPYPTPIIGGGRASKVTDKRRVDSVPANAIRVKISYPKEYGYRGSTNAFGDIGPTSCDAFHIDAAVSVKPNNLISIGGDGTMKVVGGNYVCTYLVSYLPLNEPIRLTASVASDRGLSTEAWKGGSQTEPPQGQQRTIVDGKRSVTLTDSQPSATLNFEMVYAAPPLKLPTQRVRVPKPQLP